MGYGYYDLFQRNIGLLTEEAQELLRKSTVAVAGLGGVGGITAEALARIGIGNLKIADNDVFCASNLNRQAGSFHSTLGKPKTEVLHGLIKDINPEINIEVYSDGITAGNSSGFVDGADAVVDAIDYFAPEAKLALHREARKNKQYVFSSPAAGFGALVLCFGPESPSIEEFFSYPENPEEIRGHKIPLEKILGCSLGYLPESFFKTMEGDKPYGSTNCAAVMISGGASAVQILKSILHSEQQKDPDRFKEYGRIELVTVPSALRIDGWGAEYCRIVNLGGGNH